MNIIVQILINQLNLMKINMLNLMKNLVIVNFISIKINDKNKI